MFIIELADGYPTTKYPLFGIFQLDQAKALKEIGHKVIAVAIDLRSIRHWRKWGFREYTKDDIIFVEYSIPVGAVGLKFRKSVGEYAFSRALNYIIQKYGQPDVVHVHFGDIALYAKKGCQQRDIPYVLTEHNSTMNKDYISKRILNVLKPGYHGAAKVIAVGNILARNIVRHMGVIPEVIPNVIDLSVFKCKREKHESFRIISAGNLISRKGFNVLIDAFYGFAKIVDRTELIIMGDGPERQSLEQQVKKLSLQNKVYFTGKYVREEFAEELSRCDVFALASKVETFGVVYVEALAMGLPVVSTKNGGPEDFIDTSNGILVDVDDVETLTKALIEVYRNLSAYRPLIISETIRNTFSAETIGKRIAEVLEKARFETKTSD